MRAALAVLIVVLVGAPPARATSPVEPRLTATPAIVGLGEATTIRGANWPVIEFCRRTVRLSLVSAQNAFPIGTAHVRDGGRFSRSWTPRAGRVGAGTWRLVARMRCESGDDGSPVIVRRAVRLRITADAG